MTVPPFHPNCRGTTAPAIDPKYADGERFARGEDGKGYYIPADMTYTEWKTAFVDGGSKAGLKSAADGGIMNVSTGGARNDEFLTAEQKAECEAIAIGYGMPRDRIVFVNDMLTSYMAGYDRLYIGTDVYPGTRTDRANYQLSCRAALAHEIVGHRDAFLGGHEQEISYLEEAQASLRAAKASNLTEEDRVLLIQDAKDRLPEEITLDDIVHLLYLEV